MTDKQWFMIIAAAALFGFSAGWHFSERATLFYACQDACEGHGGATSSFSSVHCVCHDDAIMQRSRYPYFKQPERSE